MQARTIIDRIEIDVQTGTVGLRMKKQVVSDDDKVISEQYHRTAFDPWTNHEKQMAAVNAHLAEMGFGAVIQADQKVLNDVMPSLATLRAERADAAKDAPIVRRTILG